MNLLITSGGSKLTSFVYVVGPSNPCNLETQSLRLWKDEQAPLAALRLLQNAKQQDQ